VFIHGYRGVGKTSLAQTAAFQLQTGTDPIIYGCGSNANFADVMGEIVRIGLVESPQLSRSTTGKSWSASLGVSKAALSGDRTTVVEHGRTPNPLSINEAVQLVKSLVGRHSEKPIILIDEFDQVRSPEEQTKFADFIKQVSDQHVPAHFIFCGIGESMDDLMKAHQSAHRYFHPIKLSRLPITPSSEIVESAAEALGIQIDRTTVFRICRLSDGFPHYIHLLSEKLFWLVYEARNKGLVESRFFGPALYRASDALEPELKTPYEKATKKYTDQYEEILFAVVDGHELNRRSSDIYSSYLRIMQTLKKNPLSREKFNSAINRLKKPSHASILLGSRQGWYEFREKVIRGYARIRAAQKGIELEVEHPEEPSKFAFRGGE
jgi:Cdc6-like AAA superfamily ATPase